MSDPQPERAQAGPSRFYKRPAERPFSPAERGHVTLIFGSLSSVHDRLLKGALQGLGYRADHLATPTRRDFQTGREYCTAGQCNPVYFVTGALINHLERLRDEEGLAPERIVADYVFVTVGSCGPCRFGMYEAQYRLALCKAGFEGFRVITFDKKAGGDGHDPGAVGDGFEINLRLYRALLNAIFAADLLNAVFHQIHPYALDSESVAAAFEKCLKECETTLRVKDYVAHPGWATRVLRPLTPLKSAEDLAQLLHQLRDPDYVRMLVRCRSIIERDVQVDRLRARPVVKITGEFWAQTTEGDGNFRMFEFLESEGAEVRIEPIAAWIDYMRHNLHGVARDRRMVAVGQASVGLLQPLRRLGAWGRFLFQDRLLRLTGWLMHREYDRLRRALGATVPPLTGQLLLERTGDPYYHARIMGGEGYLEIAKNIHAFNKGQAHMTLSLKPFGCMPSTQSDGAQAAVLARYPEMNFLPIETAGEGELNAYSRVQMSLSEAKTQSREEFRQALHDVDLSLEALHAYVARHPQLRNPFHPIPEEPGSIGRGAHFVRYVARLMARDPGWKEWQRGKTGILTDSS
ncbi:activator of (R)-2-hydroxyglutaryl-CoA dehydratase [Thioalkalivibrio sp.]|uniref:activator of (R)-2-hydroxyglutaryl-CoA dehydratase n=1 Tax=Thioalkalivibrio sp. TaxID=2093813 RepID=UPI003976F93A